MNKSITFVLSSSGQHPVGGFRIVYEYGNRLAKRGWNVSIVHPAHLWPAWQKTQLLKKLRSLISFTRRLLTRGYLPNKWMSMNPSITMLWVPSLEEKFMPCSDILVVCPVESALHASNYAANKGKKFYFIQHFEDWNLNKELVESSWKLPFQKIVIAKWLQDIAHSLNQKAIYIPNGMDFSFFKTLKKSSERTPRSICFLYHTLPWKGSQLAVDAMVHLKEKYPELTVTTFSAQPITKPLPDFITIHIDPEQDVLRNIYNTHSIFISPSFAEGWPLPPAEAMLCGCVVIATDIGGHREYLKDGTNGIFCKPGSVESIIEKVEFVFNNPQFAANISAHAPESLQMFDWDSRVDLFEKAILGIETGG